ncbi:LOW QUALITY PROTEIN: uncharacterized protein LOC132508994 [Lagenorhynchus albirostris]|uniref:LOW QUALITY PROTEIN: uncharacterized protein LOC132508994 n=1 Tax=Lagenorhynchus albirostris TaxID=27610 RepID=UPI0028E63072|nr:LOW QUALITY PROTEIN: uncharacterized protein LOC132508994 [Lagenorhynchus albirostris]
MLQGAPPPQDLAWPRPCCEGEALPFRLEHCHSEWDDTQGLEPHPVASHKEPMVCCQHNPTFRQVVSYSEASVVKVWDFETGILLSDFIEAHGNAGIRCLTFDSSGRRLVTGGRDGCLKIWSYNNGPCLHTLKHDEKQSEVYDYTYLKLSQNKCIIAVGWDRRINVYFDTPGDFHHFRKPQPHWQDDVNQGQKEDILCVAQCPPILLATSSYDGEIIIWNVISGHMHCKLNTPSPCDGTEYGERGAGSEPGGPPVRLCAPHLFQPRAGGSSATPGPGAATGEDERRAGSCMRSAAETLSSSPGPHRSVFCLTFPNTQYQLGSQLGVSRHFPNGQRAPSPARPSPEASGLSAPGALGCLCPPSTLGVPRLCFPWRENRAASPGSRRGSPSLEISGAPKRKRFCHLLEAIRQGLSLCKLYSWKLGCGLEISSMLQSRDKAWVSSMAVTTGDAWAYVADQDGSVPVYDIEEYGLQGPEPQPPRNVMFWGAHISMVTFLELIEEEKFLLSSSLDRTVHLWSTDGEYIGTFGQGSPWDIFTPVSWRYPGVPCEVLTDPQSMPAHPVLEGGAPVTHTGEEKQDKVVEGKASAKQKGCCCLWPWNTERLGIMLDPLSHQRDRHENPARGTRSPLGNTF